MDEQTEKKIQAFAQLLYEARYPVFFSGAGISTESGLPDFRGPEGVWTRRDKGLSPPSMSKPWDAVAPNSGHMALIELQNLRKLKFLNNTIMKYKLGIRDFTQFFYVFYQIYYYNSGNKNVITTCLFIPIDL